MGFSGRFDPLFRSRLLPPNSRYGYGLPPGGYLFRSRLPNTGDVVYSEDDILDADMYIGGWVLPDTDECRAAVPDDEFWYDTEGVPIARTGTQILAWSGINSFNVWFSVLRGLVLYPSGIADQVVSKIAGYYGPSVLEYTAYPSAFFNGMDFRLATYTGGPTYIADNEGVLGSPGANLPACEGFRLVTTVEDGAVLGPELITNAADSEFTSDTGFWTKETGWSIANGAAVKTAGVAGSILRPNLISIGESIQVSYKVLAVSGTGIRILRGSIVGGAIVNQPGTYIDEVNQSGSNGHCGIWCYADTAAVIEYSYFKKVIPTYLTTDESGNAILPSTPQKTVTYNTDWTAKTLAETFDKFDISDQLKAPGWLCEPARTNYALNSATPATHTTGTLADGTYTLWQEGTGSIVATAGTAVGTFGTASNGTPATITITTAGTVVLTASGANTWVQLERGAFKTSRIYTTTASMVRAATIASFPTAGKIPVNNFAIRMIVVPRASGLLYPWLVSSYIDSDNYTGIWIYSPSILFRARAGGVNTDSTVIMPSLNANIHIDLIAVKSSANMQISARQFTTSWGSIVNGTANSTSSAKANAPIASTYQLGAFNGGSQFTGNLSFDCVPIPDGTTDPMAWAKTHWGVA